MAFRAGDARRVLSEGNNPIEVKRSEVARKNDAAAFGEAIASEIVRWRAAPFGKRR